MMRRYRRADFIRAPQCVLRFFVTKGHSGSPSKYIILIAVIFKSKCKFATWISIGGMHESRVR